MARRKKQNKFVNFFATIGNYIYLFFMLQVYWIIFSLRGFIVGGVFPALSGVVGVLYQLFKDESIPSNIWEEFKRVYHENFKNANIVGYICLIVLAVLYIDFRVNATFIHSLVLQFLLLVLSFVVVIFLQYTFTVMVRYDYDVKNIFKQSFFVSLSAITFSIASLLGVIVVIWILQSIPFLALFFGVPLTLLPIVWFTYGGILDAEQKRTNAKK